jgi:hypothetical protein
MELSQVSVKKWQGEMFQPLPGYRKAEQYYTLVSSKILEVLVAFH